MTEATRVSALTEILKWSESLPDWQSDVIRRLLRQERLSETDIDEILSLLKSEIGISDGQELKAKKLSKSDIPKEDSAKSKIVLKAISNFKNVNALAANQKITFEENGLTIIYGRNATGKSGYSRVLKKACRAREREERILPDVFAEFPGGSLEATIEASENGTDLAPIQWKQGQDAPIQLSLISVFDSNCARVYVNEANAVAYIPYGLDIFERVSKTFEILKTKLEVELANLQFNKENFKELFGNTSVGKLIQNLHHNNTISEIEKLSSLTEEEELRYVEVDKKLTELKLDESKKKAAALKALNLRMTKTRSHIESLKAVLGDEKLNNLKPLLDNYLSTKKALEIASKKNFDSEPLAGVGSEAWKMLFAAAKKYSEEIAYPDHKFPYTEAKSKCVLCFQPLDEPSKQRLKRFDEFLKDETEKAFAKAKTIYDQAILKIEQASPNLFSTDANLINEIQEKDSDLADKLKAFILHIETQKTIFLNALKENKWADVSIKSEDFPIQEIERTIKSIETQAIDLDKKFSAQELEKLQNEFAELDVRKKLALKKDLLITALNNLILSEKIKQAIKQAGTSHVTRKSGDLMEQLITDRLKTNIENEFKKLEIDYQKVSLNKSGRAGVTFHQIKLNTRLANIAVSDVLSEGEQRAIALASFLAELDSSSCGIIFDDPVSSLDHERRELVAHRLVNEALKRQVIIFTHEPVFLQALISSVEKNEVNCQVRTLWADSTGTGYCDSEYFPWIAQTVRSRRTYLRNKTLPKLKSIHAKSPRGDEYSSAVKDFYEKLRETWERAIEEVVFGDCIRRLRDSVETRKLQHVEFTDADYKIIDEGMTRSSAFLHDRATAKGEIPIPDPSKLEDDLKHLENYVDQINKKVEEKRKSKQKVI